MSLGAMDAVLNTAELLEAMLEQLPFRDLVLATRVNHRFRDFINGSKKLKRKLFIIPVASTKHKLNKYGVIGGSITQAELSRNPIEEPVSLLPLLLVKSTVPKTAHISERAWKADHLSYNIFLTNPPCAHLTMHFTYVCVTCDGTHIQLEGTRSSYRAKGITLLSVRQMLSQSGAVKVQCGERKKFKNLKGFYRYNTTMYDEIESYERFYDCKMKIHLP
jgi:hypothetical protein